MFVLFAVNRLMVEDMGIEPICCPACKAGVHPMQTHPPYKSLKQEYA